MSQTQDVFGTSSKSVLNKPLMHVQDRKTSGTRGGSASAGEQDRILNSTLTNEISGASLGGNLVTLPAGTYYIEAATTTFMVKGTKLTVKDSTGTVLLTGLSGRSAADTGGAGESGNFITVASGRITLAATTQIKLVQYCQEARSTDGLGYNDGGSLEDEIYADLKIWKLDSNVETPVISDPTMTLARPLMHMQHQELTGVDGGDAITGDQTRPINTVLTNEISGASLSANEVELPAGTYYIEAASSHGVDISSSFDQFGRLKIKDEADAVLLSGIHERFISNTANVYDDIRLTCGGRITLLATTKIKMVAYIGRAKTGTGMGQSLSTGTDNEVYADLRIWQLDSLVRQPVLVNDKLYPLPGNVIVTGNMHGLEYAYKDANTVTVNPGICVDSTNEFTLILNAAQDVTIPNVGDTVYNLFLTDDAETVKADTDVNGANLPVGDKRRWIGFVRTDGTGSILEFYQSGNSIELCGDVVLATVGNDTRTLADAGLFVPSSRVSECSFSVASDTTNDTHIIRIHAADADGLEGAKVVYGATATGRLVTYNAMITGTKCWFSATAGTSTCYLRGIRLKR